MYAHTFVNYAVCMRMMRLNGLRDYDLSLHPLYLFGRRNNKHWQWLAV